jgi:hypothetical protein
MITNIALLITLLAYSVIVSQSFMYLLALRDTQLNMDIGNYIQFRKLIDRNMRTKFRYVTYSALFASMLLIPISFRAGSLSLIVASLVGFCMLVVDLLITIKGNLPINSTINDWTNDHYPTNWTAVRARWLKFFLYRQIVNITGFAVLVAGVVFR